MKRLLFSLATLTLLFSACTKVEDTISNEDMLRGGQWKRVSLNATKRLPTGTLETTNVYQYLDSCVMDNTLEFKVNYVGTERKNGWKCSAGDPEETTFNWELYNSGQNIRIYNAPETFRGESSINGVVTILTENQLAFNYKAIKVNAITQVIDTITVADVFRK